MRALGIFARSSFGFSASRSVTVVQDYAYGLCQSIRYPVSVVFGAFPDHVHGATNCIFDESNNVSGYRIRLDRSLFDLARSRQSLDKAFVSAVVAAGHEAEHVSQLDSHDTEMAICHIASSGNEDNYFENYVYNFREIAAEYAGLSSARDYLTERYPHVDADGMLLGYVNDMIREGPYWISSHDPDGFSRMPDVFRAFEDAYDDAVKHPNKYGFRMPHDSHDAFARLAYGDTDRGFDERWEFIVDALLASEDAYRSNTILASAALYVYPELIREAAGAELPDLSIYAVFGCDPPDMTTDKKPVTDSALSKLMRAIRNEDTKPDLEDPEYGP